MPSRGFFSWGNKARPAHNGTGELSPGPAISARDQREYLGPPPGVTALNGGPKRNGNAPPSPLHNGGPPLHNGNPNFGRASSQNDLNKSSEGTPSKRGHRNGSQFSSPLHNMPPYMHNIPPHLLPHFQRHQQPHPHAKHNTRPHSVYWDQHNFPPQLLTDDRPGGRYVDPTAALPPGLKGHQKYSSTFDVSATRAPRAPSGDRSGGRGPGNDRAAFNGKPTKSQVSSSAADVRYRSKQNLSDKGGGVASMERKSKVLSPADPSSSPSNAPLNNTLPPYWLPYEHQLHGSTNSNTPKGKYSKNKNAKNKNKKSEKAKENKQKKDKKSKKGDKSNLDYEKKAKLYKSHEELRSSYAYHDDSPHHAEKLAPAEKLKGGGVRDGGIKIGKLEKAKTLERLDNIDTLDDDDGDADGGYFSRRDRGRDSHRRSTHDMREAQARTEMAQLKGHEMREIEHNKEHLWMEEQERMRRSAENIAFRRSEVVSSPDPLDYDAGSALYAANATLQVEPPGRSGATHHNSMGRSGQSRDSLDRSGSRGNRDHTDSMGRSSDSTNHTNRGGGRDMKNRDDRLAYDEATRVQQDQEEIQRREALVQENKLKEQQKKQQEYQINQLVSYFFHFSSVVRLYSV